MQSCLYWLDCSASSSTNDVKLDAGPPDVVDAPYIGEVCCQITNDFTTDPRWQNKLYGCDETSVPWVCARSADSSNAVFSCDDPRCQPGVWCQGFNGTGVVISCN